MKSLAGLLLAALLCSCATTTPHGGKTADSFQLQVRLKKGEAHLQKMTMEQVVTQQIQGMEIVVNQTMGFDMLQEVLDVDDKGNANLKVTYVAARLKHSSMMGEFNYDSANPPQELPPQAMGIAALVGNGFKMKVDSRGEILSISGLDELLENAIKALDVEEGPMRVALAKALKEQFGEAAMKESMSQQSTIYPNKKLSVGDTWEQKSTTTRGFAAIMDTKYTVSSRKDGIVSVEISSFITENPKGEPMDMGVARMRYNVRGMQKGTIAINEKTGIPTRMNIRQKLDGTVKLLDENEEWPISIESTITVEVTKKK